MTGLKLSLAGTTIFGGLAAVVPDNLPIPPQSLTGYGSIVLGVLTLIWIAIGEYKRRQADTTNAVIGEKKKLIDAMENTIKYLQGAIDSSQAGVEQLRVELEEYRKMHDAYRISMQRVAWKNAAMEALLHANNIPVPNPPIAD